MTDRRAVCALQLSVKTESDIREMFVHHDTDQSGSIDVRELHMVFAAFNGARFDVRMSLLCHATSA